MKQSTLDLIKNINENTFIPATTQNELFELFQLDTVADLRKVSRNFMKVYELLEHFDNQTSNATKEKEGIVKFGTEAGNAIDAETWKQAIGQTLGGYVSKVENKEAGKWYINDLTDGKIYKCIQTHTSTSFDITKFVDITNVGLSDKVENLFGFGESWIKFPNGLVLFWKSYLITEYPQTCHFPLEFNSVPNILVTPVYGGTNLDFNVYVDTATKKSVKVFNKNKGWIVILAIGYAK
uniref:Uncharacterized protein n=1 Tax=Myoviridae sp. ct3it16 TaxID=2825027 RepID=A0A8S5PGH2_9CAUD|nr:MAG TPA: hypothetical protein [Myoviridae sp. ct3it16]